MKLYKNINDIVHIYENCNHDHDDDIASVHFGLQIYRKFSIKPPGGLIDFKHFRAGLNGERGLIREGG